jgi:hypothetical protein
MCLSTFCGLHRDTEQLKVERNFPAKQTYSL